MIRSFAEAARADVSHCERCLEDSRLFLLSPLACEKPPTLPPCPLTAALLRPAGTQPLRREGKRQGSLSGGKTADSCTHDESATDPHSRPRVPRPAQWLWALMPALLAPARARSARGRAGGMDAFGRAVSAMAPNPRPGTAPPHRLVFAACWASRGSARARGGMPSRRSCSAPRPAPRGARRCFCASCPRRSCPPAHAPHLARAFPRASTCCGQPPCRGKLCGRVLPVIPKLSSRSTAALRQRHIMRSGSELYQMPA